MGTVESPLLSLIQQWVLLSLILQQQAKNKSTQHHGILSTHSMYTSYILIHATRTYGSQPLPSGAKASRRMMTCVKREGQARGRAEMSGNGTRIGTCQERQAEAVDAQQNNHPQRVSPSNTALLEKPMGYKRGFDCTSESSLGGVWHKDGEPDITRKHATKIQFTTRMKYTLKVFQTILYYEKNHFHNIV